MKIKTIECARKFNLGNYESEDLRIGAELDENEDVAKAVEELKQRIIALGPKK